MRRVAALLVVLSATVLTATGCAPKKPTPTPEQEQKLAKLPPPSKGWEDAVKKELELKLKDPMSAQYKFETPEKCYFDNGVIGVGYRTIVLINGKNSYGGYTGYQPFYFFIHPYELKVKHVTAPDYFQVSHPYP
jgi:hypothetical protein